MLFFFSTFVPNFKVFLMKRFFIAFLMGGLSVFGQSTTESKNTSRRLEALPYYDFGKGMGLTAPDSIFQINLRFRMQNRFDAAIDDEGKLGYEGFIRRLRLRFDGFVKDPKLGYVVQLSFAPRDVNGNHIIRDAIVFYRPDKHWFMSFGQTKLPGNRQRINSSGALQLSDRSINNAAFNIDRDFGFQVHYTNRLSQDFEYSVKTAITTGEGRDFIDRTTGLAYTTRLELFPLGKFKKGGEYFEGDILREETPKLYLGATYHYNHNALKTQGQNGKNFADKSTRNLQNLLVDALMKYNGWAVMGSYMQRTTPDPISGGQFVVAGSGADAQISYAFPNQWEIASRYSELHPTKKLKDIMPLQKQFSLGVTKYIWEHAFKAQLEVTHTQEKLLGNTQKDWFVRFQVEIGI